MQADTTERQLPFGELIAKIIAEGKTLIQQEFRLAAAESKPKLAKAAVAIGLFLVAAIFALGVFGALTATFIIALSLVLPLWAAALIVTVVYAIVAAIAVQQGIASLKKSGSLVPVQTLQTIKEDVTMLRAGVEQGR